MYAVGQDSTLCYKYTEPKEDHRANEVIFHFGGKKWQCKWNINTFRPVFDTGSSTYQTLSDSSRQCGAEMEHRRFHTYSTSDTNSRADGHSVIHVDSAHRGGIVPAAALPLPQHLHFKVSLHHHSYKMCVY